MPELPDVESYRRFFLDHAAGRVIARVAVPDAVSLRNSTGRGVNEALRGRRFSEPERTGKWLYAWTDDGPGLLFHFGMTGWFLAGDSPEGRHPHDRLIVELVDGSELRYRNMRKFGGVWLAHDRDEARSITGELGPDALGVGKREFLARLARRRGGLKAVLMDQSFVAGIGNLLADEVLWQARLHPRRPLQTLSDEERAELYRRVRHVARESVERFDYVPRKRGWLNHVRGNPGAVCPRCRTPLERITAAGRTTYLCPTCQPG